MAEGVLTGEGKDKYDDVIKVIKGYDDKKLNALFDGAKKRLLSVGLPETAIDGLKGYLKSSIEDVLAKQNKANKANAREATRFKKLLEMLNKKMSKEKLVNVIKSVEISDEELLRQGFASIRESHTMSVNGKDTVRYSHIDRELQDILNQWYAFLRNNINVITNKHKDNKLLREYVAMHSNEIKGLNDISSDSTFYKFFLLQSKNIIKRYNEIQETIRNKIISFYTEQSSLLQKIQKDYEMANVPLDDVYKSLKKVFGDVDSANTLIDKLSKDEEEPVVIAKAVLIINYRKTMMGFVEEKKKLMADMLNEFEANIKEIVKFGEWKGKTAQKRRDKWVSIGTKFNAKGRVIDTDKASSAGTEKVDKAIDAVKDKKQKNAKKKREVEYYLKRATRKNTPDRPLTKKMADILHIYIPQEFSFNRDNIPWQRLQGDAQRNGGYKGDDSLRNDSTFTNQANYARTDRFVSGSVGDNWDYIGGKIKEELSFRYDYMIRLNGIRNMIAQDRAVDTVIWMLAAFFQAIVSMTPLDERWRRDNNQDGDEGNKKRYHYPDRSFLRGDWVLTFAGVSFKAFPTEPRRKFQPRVIGGGNYVYISTERDETSNSADSGCFGIVGDAYMVEEVYERMKEGLEGKTINSFDFSVENVDYQKWQWLEYGGVWSNEYGIVEHTEAAHGARYAHGVDESMTYQAPYGFTRLAEAKWNEIVDHYKEISAANNLDFSGLLSERVSELVNDIKMGNRAEAESIVAARGGRYKMNPIDVYERHDE